jgi:hypothetical protein
VAIDERYARPSRRVVDSQQLPRQVLALMGSWVTASRSP